MKIVYSMPAVMLCGGSVHHFFVIQRLVAKGHQVSIYSPVIQDLELLPVLPDSVKIHTHEKVTSNLYTLPSEKTPFKFLKTFRDLTFGLSNIASDLPPDADVIQAVFYPNAIAAHRMREKSGSKAALIQSIHASPKFFLDVSYRRYSRFWAKSPNLADRIFSVSKKDSQYLEETYRRPVTMVGNGLDDEILLGPPGNKAIADQILDIENRSYLLFVGSITGIKGIDITLKAFVEIKKSKPELLLALVGKGNWVPYYQNLARNLGILDSVRVVPGVNRENLRHILDHSSCFVYPSRAEGFGIPPLEAMARGIPVVCTPSDGLEEFARENENCLMVPPENPIRLADEIKNVLENKELVSKLSKNGKDTAKCFSWDSVAERTEEGMFKAIERRKKSQ